MTLRDGNRWVENMFSNGGINYPIAMHDYAEKSALERSDLSPDTIPILVDFASNNERNSSLKGKHVIILGGCHSTRASQGKLLVPTDQMGELIDRLTQLKQYLDQNLGQSISNVRARRTNDETPIS